MRRKKKKKKFSILPLEEVGVDGFSGNKTLSALKLGHEFEQTPGDSGGQGSLACCSPWGRRVRRDLATEQLIQYLKFE